MFFFCFFYECQSRAHRYTNKVDKERKRKKIERKDEKKANHTKYG